MSFPKSREGLRPLTPFLPPPPPPPLPPLLPPPPPVWCPESVGRVTLVTCTWPWESDTLRQWSSNLAVCWHPGGCVQVPGPTPT